MGAHMGANIGIQVIPITQMGAHMSSSTQMGAQLGAQMGAQMGAFCLPEPTSR